MSPWKRPRHPKTEQPAEPPPADLNGEALESLQASEKAAEGDELPPEPGALPAPLPLEQALDSASWARTASLREGAEAVSGMGAGWRFTVFSWTRGPRRYYAGSGSAGGGMTVELSWEQAEAAWRKATRG